MMVQFGLYLTSREQLVTLLFCADEVPYDDVVYDDGWPQTLDLAETLDNLRLVEVGNFQLFPHGQGYILGWCGPCEITPYELQRLEALRVRLVAQGRFQGEYILV